MNTSNLKDTVSTICGIVGTISGAVVLMVHSGVAIPQVIANGALAAGILAGAVLSYLTGKNPDGTTKTAEQVSAQNPVKPS